MIKGTTIQIEVETVTGHDPFGAPIVSVQTEDVTGVLVGQPTTDDVTNALQLYGKKIEYVLGIPKGDTHDWTDATVYIWGDKFHTVGFPQTGIQENIPLKWGQNVKVERYG
jgi:hypothetical protein